MDTGDNAIQESMQESTGVRSQYTGANNKEDEEEINEGKEIITSYSPDND
jgi:hypothetical protein